MFQVDAFAGEVFRGNPAAVCMLDEWPDATLMQSIAAENNLAETAFVVSDGGTYRIRWFTPTTEVDLCGHATLASAWVLFNLYDQAGERVEFDSVKSGKLTVENQDGMLFLDFPSDVISPSDLRDEVQKCLGVAPLEVYQGRTDIMAVLSAEQEIASLAPVLARIASLPARGIIVTSPGDQVDFVSRFFAPQSGINEDPVTGSAHTTLIPYWAKKLGKNELSANQLSSRGGHLECVHSGERCQIGGTCVLYLTGEIFVPD